MQLRMGWQIHLRHRIEERMKQTLLNDWHLRNKAHMAEFGGYSMPLWYAAGPIKEHRSVLQAAGLFDTSHMAQLLIEGPHARILLQAVLTKDLDRCLGRNARPLTDGRATYGFILKENGHVLDDAIVMQEGQERFLLVVNAGMGSEVHAHLSDQGQDLSVVVNDLTDKLSKFDVQGPAAAKIVRRVLRYPDTLKPMPYFSFCGHYDHPESGVIASDGTIFQLSRTGYTGEFGFEIFVRPDRFPHLWELFHQATEAEGGVACGLGARDSLRAGAVLPLSHQDIGEWPCVRHPWEFALPYKSDGTTFTKPFIGDQALVHPQSKEHTYAFAGFNGRKVEAGSGSRVHYTEENIGHVLTCATDMAIDRIGDEIVSMNSAGVSSNFAPKGLCCGFVRVNKVLHAGDRIQLADKRRTIDVEIVEDVRPDRTARKNLF